MNSFACVSSGAVLQGSFYISFPLQAILQIFIGHRDSQKLFLEIVTTLPIYFPYDTEIKLLHITVIDIRVPTRESLVFEEIRSRLLPT